MTPEEMRAHILEAPAPLEGEPIYDRYEGDLETGYDICGRALARALLILCEEQPELLDVSAERKRDESGFEAASNDKAYVALNQRWPDLNDWLGGPTGFQWGWAHNSVRYVLGVEPTGNPALVTIRQKGEEEEEE